MTKCNNLRGWDCSVVPLSAYKLVWGFLLRFQRIELCTQKTLGYVHNLRHSLSR